MFSSKKYNTGNKIEIESLHFKYKITYQNGKSNDISCTIFKIPVLSLQFVF